MSECPFCDIASIRSPSILDLGDTLIFEPLRPVTPGHVLVVPKEHVVDFAADPVIAARTVGVAAEHAALHPGDYNLLISKGDAATQTVRHLHIHLVPRREGDGLALPWTNQQAAPAPLQEG